MRTTIAEVEVELPRGTLDASEFEPDELPTEDRVKMFRRTEVVLAYQAATLGPHAKNRSDMTFRERRTLDAVNTEFEVVLDELVSRVLHRLGMSWAFPRHRSPAADNAWQVASIAIATAVVEFDAAIVDHFDSWLLGNRSGWLDRIKKDISKENDSRGRSRLAVHVLDSDRKLGGRMGRATEDLRQVLGREPTRDEVLNHLDPPTSTKDGSSAAMARARTGLNSHENRAVSLDAELGHDSSQPYTRMDIIRTESSGPDFEDIPIASTVTPLELMCLDASEGHRRDNRPWSESTALINAQIPSELDWKDVRRIANGATARFSTPHGMWTLQANVSRQVRTHPSSVELTRSTLDTL